MPGHRIAPAASRLQQVWCVIGEADGRPILRRVDRWGNIRGVGLTGQAISMIVREAVARVGLDPAGYSGHSLRAGFVSECDRRGISTTATRMVTGHASDAMLSVYARPRSLFDQSAGALFNDVGEGER